MLVIVCYSGLCSLIIETFVADYACHGLSVFILNNRSQQAFREDIRHIGMNALHIGIILDKSTAQCVGHRSGDQIRNGEKLQSTRVFGFVHSIRIFFV
jgi:hypothetical protein